jgi:transcriptional regulator with XRE-family HTH domain
MSIQARVKALRKQLDITQEDLAQAIGVRSASYARWERSNRDCYAKNLARMALTLKTSADYLLELTDDPTPPHR